jgi:hypothetical protein
VINKKFIITIAVLAFLITGTLIAIRFAKGYRLDLSQKKVTETGLLVTNSFPTGASVYINDKLTTATDDTLNLPPGNYQVKISKDGYIPWEKNLVIEKELVTQANARLFPAVPDLKALTYTGALNITPSPNGEKIAYVIASASASLKNGLWVLNLQDKTLAFSKDSQQVAEASPNIDLTQAKLYWSPSGSQILVKNEQNSFLLNINKLNNLTTQEDVTATLPLILDDWEEELQIKTEEKIKKLPLEMQQIATNSAKNLFFSPDGEKLLYKAVKDNIIPENLIPPLPASNNQPEQRNIKTGNIYVYDLKEDKNFFIKQSQNQEKDEDNSKEEQNSKTTNQNQEENTKTKLTVSQRLNNIENIHFPLKVQKVQWFPTSNHLLLLNDKIELMEYDGTNKAVVYAGPFEKEFVFPSPNGSRILILTTLNPDSPLPPNLYAIDLK